MIMTLIMVVVVLMMMSAVVVMVVVVVLVLVLLLVVGNYIAVQVPRRQGEDSNGCLHCALNVSLAALSDYKGRPRSLDANDGEDGGDDDENNCD